MEITVLMKIHGPKGIELLILQSITLNHTNPKTKLRLATNITGSHPNQDPIAINNLPSPAPTLLVITA